MAKSQTLKKKFFKIRSRIISVDILKGRALSMENVYLSVVMPTYNHKAYISEAIENVLRQKTTFLFELIIGEDLSTDGTREIVLNYQNKNSDIIRVITSDSNVGAKENMRRMLAASRGKYIAFCDGDDYWHDPSKLQKQVDFLDSHPDYGLVHTDADYLKTEKNKLIPNFNKNRKRKVPVGRVYEELLRGNFICTCTVCVRGEFVDRWQKDAEFSNIQFIQGDYSKWLFIAWYSNIGYLAESTATKRKLRGSMSHPISPQKKYGFYMSIHEIKKTYMARFPCSKSTQDMVNLHFQKEKLKFAYISKNFQSAKESYFILRRKSCPTLKNKFYFFGAFIKSLISRSK